MQCLCYLKKKIAKSKTEACCTFHPAKEHSETELQGRIVGNVGDNKHVAEWAPPSCKTHPTHQTYAKRKVQSVEKERFPCSPLKPASRPPWPLPTAKKCCLPAKIRGC